MAHTCPDCYLVCFCGGDIDDMIMEGSEEELNCGHCWGNEDLGDDDEEALAETEES